MRNKAKIFILAIVGLLMAACNRGVIYYHYEHVDEEGWERTDTIHFYIPAVKEAGSYRQKLLLRTDNSVPFQNLNVTIEQDIYPRDMKLSKSINCILIDKNGGVNGKGISCFQYAFDMDNVDLYEGDSLHICVTHNMKRETMPGVNDIGILISK